MRKTAEKLLKAYRAGKPAGCGNSHLTTDGRCFLFSLHGHPIVGVSGSGEVSVSFAGWPTVTTRSRINDLCYGLVGKCPVSQRDFLQYCDGKQVSSDHGLWYPVGKVNG